MRLFVAVRIPEEIKKEIGEKFLARVPKEAFKVVPEENLHFTLLFIGFVEGEKAGQIKERFAKINFRKFEAEVCGIGSFGSRVLWLGLSRGKKEFSELAGMVSETLGIRQDRPFSPHLTLARGKDVNAAEMHALVERLGKTVFRKGFVVGSCSLMESALTPLGPRYTVVSERTF